MKQFSSERMKGIERTLIRRIHEQADPSCINLGLGELRFPTPKPILDYVKENSSKWHLGYTPNEGLRELRELIALNSGDKVTANQVCVTIGAEEALFATIMVVVSPGDEVLVPDPGFPAYPTIIKMAGGEPRTYPLYVENNFCLKSEDVARCMTDKTKAVILNSPNNPSGAIYSGRELEKLAKLCDEQNILAISDEVYRDINFEGQPNSIARYAKNYVVIHSLSKTFSMTGWRLGWCIAPPELVRLIVIFQQLAVTCAAALSQYAAIFALRGLADKEKLENREELRKRRDLAMACLEKCTDLSYIKPSGTFYIFVDVSKKMRQHGNSLEISLNLLSKEKVVTIPGAAFGERGEGYLRLSFAAYPEQIEEGIRRIGHFLAKA